MTVYITGWIITCFQKQPSPLPNSAPNYKILNALINYFIWPYYTAWKLKKAYLLKALAVSYFLLFLAGVLAAYSRPSLQFAL